MKSLVYFDIAVHGTSLGRITFELFMDQVPKTAKNFLALCRGTVDGLHYKGSRFHRVIKGFMVQGGDIVNGDGSGGVSIYGSVFEDESFVRKHDQPLLLSSANRGPDTNASQFFITCAICPHLDDKHVVFGRVVSGEDIVRKMEELETNSDDEPIHLAIITDCGEVREDTAQIVEEEEEIVDQQVELDQDETNPYVIGIAPPEETNVPLRFLSQGVGKRVFKPPSRPESATDKSGRKVKGRGMIVFLFDIEI
jgi:peptidyl-prolyl isomerase D